VPTDAEISRARVFSEPLVPIGGRTTGQENTDLADAVTAFLRQGDPEQTAPIVAFLNEHPRSAWRASLLTNLGAVYRRTGHLSKALVTWQAAWRLCKDEDGPVGRAMGDRAVGELAMLYASMGDCGRLEALFREIEGRDVRGSAEQRIAAARQGLWLMRDRPAEAFACGQRALERILKHQARAGGAEQALDLRATKSGPFGTSLVYLQTLAGALGLRTRMAKRIAGAAVIVPAVVHWDTGPFAAVLEQLYGRYLVYDPSLAEDLWLSARALDEEASGYFLVPDGPLPPGWRSVAPDEGERVWYPMPSLLVDAQPATPAVR
jgi:hypothetical protein